MQVDQAALRLCVAVAENSEMPNTTARIAAWVVGTAQKLGGFPLEVSVKEIQHGFIRGSTGVDGTGCHHNTISAALDWLQENRILQVSSGRYLSGGHSSKVITFV